MLQLRMKRYLSALIVEVNKEGTVERISINGNSSFNKGAYFEKDAPILITYYHKED